MKKMIFFIAVFTFIAGKAAISQTLDTDTIIRLNGKNVQIKESDEKLKVKVFEVREENDTIYSSQVFEGVYKNGVSKVRRFNNDIAIPFTKKWRQQVSNPHWSGFGIGFANLTDGSLRMNSAEGMDVRSGKSFQFTLNLYDHAFQISRLGWAIVTGFGFRWDVYRFDGNIRMEEISGITQIIPAPKNVHYTTSRLKMTRFTIPLLLEWQRDGHCKKKFFASAGIVLGAKIYSNSVIKYRDENNHKQKEVLGKDMNLHPITMDILAQVGYRSVGLYAMYSPFSLFEKNKGPKAYPMALGLMWYF